jgi:hypothetical protein
MADLFGKLVVRTYAPKRRAWLLGSGALLCLLGLYAAFELGRYEAGFQLVDSMRGALAASARIRDLEAVNSRQREELEAADVARRVDHEGYKRVQDSLGDMQNQIAQLNTALAFYRGLVQPDSLGHVKVQQMQIVPEAAAGQFRLKFVLMQTGKPEKEVTGTVAIAVDGLARGKPVNLSLYQVSTSRHAGLSYSFRYFQDYDEVIQLPQGFEATRIDLEIHTGKDSSHGFRQAFLWKVQGMSLETEAAGTAQTGSGTGIEAGAGTGAAGRQAGKGTADVQVETE